jgi:hypothetical protein
VSKQSHEPAYRAFSVIEREGRDPFWQPIGAAFENSDGSLNIILQAYPLPGRDGVVKVVLRRPKDDQTDDRGENRERPGINSGSRRK